MIIRWNNGYLLFGWQLHTDAYGVSVAWGRRDLMGETVRDGEAMFADTKTAVLCTGRDVRVHGSVFRSIANRMMRKVFG